jgi:Protein of unknown function (DUF4019)
MKIARGLAIVALIATTSAATAQLKPSGPADPPLPSSPVEAKKAEAQAVKEMAARLAAEKWLGIVDSGDYGKAWDQSARKFRESVTRQQWVESLPKTRGTLGAMKSRRVEVASYKSSLPGMPEGDYVTVRFATQFAKKDEAQEMVTLVFEDGNWRPLGYGIG